MNECINNRVSGLVRTTYWGFFFLFLRVFFFGHAWFASASEEGDGEAVFVGWHFEVWDGMGVYSRDWFMLDRCAWYFVYPPSVR